MGLAGNHANGVEEGIIELPTKELAVPMVLVGKKVLTTQAYAHPIKYLTTLDLIRDCSLKLMPRTKKWVISLSKSSRVKNHQGGRFPINTVS